MTNSTPAWMKEEDERSEELKKSGTTENATAPRLERVTRAPKRMQKAFYIQDQHAAAFERLVFEQKTIKGKKAPALAEEAIELLLAKYKQKL